MTRARLPLAVPILAAVFVGAAAGGALTTALLQEPPAAAVVQPAEGVTQTQAPAVVLERETSIIAAASVDEDVHVTGAMEQPQVILTTAPATFDGGPVRVELQAAYANMIPDPASSNNAIGFELYVDGVKVQRLAMFGSHSQTSLFGPVNLAIVLRGADAPAPGEHTISIGVWRWSPNGDGYLKAAGSAMPVQLTVTRL